MFKGLRLKKLCRNPIRVPAWFFREILILRSYERARGGIDHVHAAVFEFDDGEAAFGHAIRAEAEDAVDPGEAVGVGDGAAVV